MLVTAGGAERVLALSDRVWFKSRFGLDATEIRRDASLCTYVLLEPEMLVVPDALQDERFRDIPVVAEEPRLVAMADAHPLAGRAVVDFTDLLDEPFLALPESAGALRDHWLATDARGGRPAVIGAEVASSEETYEALVAGLGVVLLAAGNTPLITLGQVVTRPVRGISPSRFALAWRADDHRPLVREYVRACELATEPVDPG